MNTLILRVLDLIDAMITPGGEMERRPA